MNIRNIAFLSLLFLTPNLCAEGFDSLKPHRAETYESITQLKPGFYVDDYTFHETVDAARAYLTQRYPDADDPRRDSWFAITNYECRAFKAVLRDGGILYVRYVGSFGDGWCEARLLKDGRIHTPSDGRGAYLVYAGVVQCCKFESATPSPEGLVVYHMRMVGSSFQGGASSSHINN